MSIYLSTGAFQSREIGQILKLAQERDLNHIELSAGLTPSDHLIDSVLVAASNGTNFLVHNYFPPPKIPFVLNLAATDADTYAASMDMCRYGIDLSAHLGAPYYSVHAGFCFYLTPAMLGDPVTQATVPTSLYVTVEQAYDIFLNSVEELARYAAERGVALYIENNVVSPKYLADQTENRGLLLAEPDEMVQFMADVSAPNVKILLDVAHLNVSANALNFDNRRAIETMGPYIGALHLSDNDRIVDNNQLIKPSSWFFDSLSNFTDLIWVIEVYNLPIELIVQQIALLQTARQMQKGK